MRPASRCQALRYIIIAVQVTATVQVASARNIMILDNLLNQPPDTLEICVRARAYGSSGRADLIRDVIGLANLPGSEPRFIIIGASREEGGVVATGLDDRALAEIENYADLVRQYIEPEPRVRIECGSVKGKVIAVLQISGCDNPPYMVATDLSQDMKTGACVIREPGLFRAARRRDLDRMYGARVAAEPEFEVAAPLVQIGFNNDPCKAQFVTRLPDLLGFPSAIAAKRLQDQIRVVKAAGERNVTDSSVARLVHAQQYGAELPYDERGVNTLVENYNSVADEFHDADEYFFHETNALKLSFCIRNNSEQMLENLTVVLTLPVVDEFRVVEHLCAAPGSERSRHESDLLGYPEVSYYKAAAQVRQDIEQLPPGAERPLFESALRVALAPNIAGKKIAIRYALHGRGLATPQEGVLKLLLKNPV